MAATPAPTTTNPTTEYNHKIPGDPIKLSRCDVLDTLGALAVIALVTATALAILNMTGTANISGWMTNHIGSNAANIAMIAAAAFGSLVLIGTLISRAIQGAKSTAYYIQLEEAPFDLEATAGHIAAQLNTDDMAKTIAIRVETQLAAAPRNTYNVTNDLNLHSAESGAAQVVVGSVARQLEQLDNKLNVINDMPSALTSLQETLAALQAQVDKIAANQTANEGREVDEAGEGDNVFKDETLEPADSASSGAAGAGAAAGAKADDAKAAAGAGAAAGAKADDAKAAAGAGAAAGAKADGAKAGATGGAAGPTPAAGASAAAGAKADGAKAGATGGAAGPTPAAGASAAAGAKADGAKAGATGAIGGAAGPTLAAGAGAGAGV